MAVNDRTEFYVTKGAAVDDLNGGGPQLGTDDAPIYHLDGAGGADATVAGGALTTIVDNSGNDWAGCLIDDWLVWDTDGVKEHRTILALAGANATVNLNCTALANKKVRVGGAWEHVDHAASVMGSSTTNTAGDSPVTYIKYDVNPYQEEFEIDNAGTATLWLTFEGYETTPGDECPSGNLPHIEGPAGAALDGTCYVAAGTDYHIIRWLKISAQTNGKHAIDSASDYTLFENLSLEASGTVARGLSSAGTSVTCRNIYVSATDRGISLGGNSHVRGCRVVAGTVGVSLSYASSASYNIISGTSDDCIVISGSATIADGNTCYGSTGGSGIKIAERRTSLIQNNICEGNNQYGIEGTCDKGIDWNFTLDNDQGAHNNAVHWGANNVAYTASAFVNAPTDMHLNNTPGGGALIRGQGWPGTFLKGDHTGYLDGGALQHEGRIVLGKVYA